MRRRKLAGMILVVLLLGVVALWLGSRPVSAQEGTGVPLVTPVADGHSVFFPVVGRFSSVVWTPGVNTLRGHVQKGPFVQGTEITVRELDDDFVPTGRTYSGQIEDNTGRFSVRGSLVSPFVELSANGFYFNELTGSISAAPISLQALVDLRYSTTVNVNLLTHLERARLLMLLEGGLPFSVAKQQAQREVLAMFNLGEATIQRSETLDIAQDGEGNAILLAISALVQSDKSEGKLTELLSALSNDLRTDGVLSSASLRQTLAAGMEYLKPRRVVVRSNVVNRYAELGVAAIVPPFEAYAFALDVVAPAVASTSPSDGADQDVSVVTIVFNELMDHATLISSTVSVSDASSNLITGTLGLTDTDSETTVAFTPHSGLLPGIYQLTIDAGVQDLAGNGLAAVAIGFTHTVSISGLVASSSLTTLGDVTYFTATISSGSNVTYVWEFGDGSAVGSGSSITHTYSALGYYTAIVTATNTLSSVSALRQTILFNGWTEDEILIPAGSFQMGCDSTNLAETFCEVEVDELPLHKVTLDAFYIDKYEVTNARYKMCVNAGQCTEPQSTRSRTRESYYHNATFADYPVINLFWQQTVDFCTWDGKRLPTEAEWEMAARGTSDTRKYPWGNSEPDCTKLNFRLAGGDYCVGGDTNQVGVYPAGASPYGVMDMGGNVWEWTADWFGLHYYSTSPASNPQGPATESWHVGRGGSWNDSSPRVAHRYYDYLDYWNNDTSGIRCARIP